MSVSCPKCRSFDVQDRLGDRKCANCGISFGFDGSHIEPAPAESLVGNIADLHRSVKKGK